MEARELRTIIADNIRQQMDVKGITSVAELSRLANLPQTTLNLYMTPDKPRGLPNLKHLVALAEFFGLEPWELLCPISEAERAVIKSMEAWMRSRGGN